ncbi:MAG TPA: L,D-transpeptidase [Polyangiaceae bacterium]|nr:L,D-transpeptidase [Polyangiaceae bacterium]
MIQLRVRTEPIRVPFLGVLALLGCSRCDRAVPEGEQPERRVVVVSAGTGGVGQGTPTAQANVPATTSAVGIAGAPAAAVTAPHPGPWLTVLQPSIAIYSEPSADRSNKLGYAQSGAKIAVQGSLKPSDKCASGWIEVVPTGYVCTATGTLDEKDPRVRFTLKPPSLENVLPYTYARNGKNGTPLYRSIPTRAQMLEYEPYLRKEDKPAATDAAVQAGGAGSTSTVAASSAATPTPSPAPTTSNGVVAAPPQTTANPENSGMPDDRPWWQQDGIEDRLHEIRLSDLQKESDGILALRMVKGFYVAVDRTFHWSGRTWYKTTKGLVAPADRMGQATPSDFKGVELGSDWHLPVGWVYGGREKANTYEIDPEKLQVRNAGSVARFQAIQLTERSVEIGKSTYREMADGKWIKQEQIRVTVPGEAPKELGPNERWIDVNLSRQTLIVFEGNTPIYATLVSTGKSSKIKEKDHATPVGMWRLREKHLTTTMDGDGTAAGDLPYSIEDVPFVMYFHKSYAIHGAFWHRNYGVQMSHGCINLAPLDAKAVFFRSEPALPEGWHGVWSARGRLGSWVSIHE